MPRNKQRLMLALYARPKHPDSPHYALLITPKPDITSNKRDTCAVPATKYHALNTLQVISGQASQPWRFERSSLANLHDEHRLLACIVIAKILDQGAAEGIFEKVPLYQHDDPDREEAERFDCVGWVREALDRLRVTRAVSSLATFEDIERNALEFVAKKKSEGRWTKATQPGIPILDLLQGKELAT